MRPFTECLEDDCTTGASVRGLCKKHYQRAYKAGQIHPRKPLSDFRVAMTLTERRRRALQKLVIEQAGRCAICHQEATLYLDHDHASGRVRGALCQYCNPALGLLKDDPARLESAIAYLSQEVRDDLGYY